MSRDVWHALEEREQTEEHTRSALLRFASLGLIKIGWGCRALYRCTVHVTVETAPFLFVFLSKRNKSPLPSFYDSIIQPKMPLRPGPERGASRLPTQAINGLEDLCVCAGPTQVPNHARGQDDVHRQSHQPFDASHRREPGVHHMRGNNFGKVGRSTPF